MNHLGRKPVLSLYMLMVAVIAVACGGGGSGTLAGGGIGGTGITASGAITGFGSIFVTENEFQIVPGTTSISADDSPASESDLRVGMVVTVRGTVAADGSVIATTVDFDADVEGPVADVPEVTGNDNTEKSFTVLGTKVFVNINDTVFDDSDASGITFANISQGDIVQVSGFYDQNGDLHASFIERDDSAVFVPDSTEVEVKGTVSNLAGNSFMLGNMTINFDPGSTDLSDLPGATVAEGMFVEVKGTLAAADSTTLAATRIELEGLGDDEGETEIEGIVSGFTGLGNTFHVAGQAVDASGTVQFEPAGLSLVDGIEVEVEGSLADGVLVADEIKLRGGSIEIETVVVNFDAGARSIELGPLGLNAKTLSVRTDDQTRFEDVTFDTLDIGGFLKVEALDEGDGNLLATRIKQESSTGDYLLQGPTDPSPATQDPFISILGVTFDTSNLGNNFEDESDAPIGRGPFFARAEAGNELVKVKDDNPADGEPNEVEFED